MVYQIGHDLVEMHLCGVHICCSLEALAKTFTLLFVLLNYSYDPLLSNFVLESATQLTKLLRVSRVRQRCGGSAGAVASSEGKKGSRNFQVPF